MRTKKKIYHKLVRDKIPEILEDKGIKYKAHLVKGKSLDSN